MKAKGTILRMLCAAALLCVQGSQAASAAEGSPRSGSSSGSSSSSSSGSGVSVNTVNGETVVTVHGNEVYRGRTSGRVSSVSRSENGVEYSAILDGDTVLWESSPGAAGKPPTGVGSSSGSVGGGGGGIDHDAFLAEHQANFDRMVREMQQQAGQGIGSRSSGSLSGSSRSGGRAMSGSGGWSSSGGSARAGGSSGGFSSGSSRGSAGGSANGSGSGMGRASGGGTSNGGGASSGIGADPGMGHSPSVGSFIPQNPAGSRGALAGRPAPANRTPSAVQPTVGTGPAKRSNATPAPEAAAVTFKVVEGSSVVVFRDREFPVGPTYERLTGKSWSQDGKEYAIAKEGDRVIWENVPGAAKRLAELGE